MCIELFPFKIPTTEDIKGITYANYEFRKSLFADDASFILDGSLKSSETLVDILDNLSYISGLKLNFQICHVLRLGSMIQNEVEFKKRKFKYSSNEASSLGFPFCTDNTHIYQANLEPKSYFLKNS